VSGVYFFHHSDFLPHQIGKLGALREIALALEYGYDYYYMGYYVATCQKMLYKATYNPHYILDPETYEWNVLTTEMKSKLAEAPYYSPSAALVMPVPYYLLPTYNPSMDTAEAAAERGDAPLLFYPRIPGALSQAEIEKQWDIGELQICAHDKFFTLRYTNLWDLTGDSPNRRIRQQLNELVSVLGTNLASRITIDFDSPRG